MDTTIISRESMEKYIWEIVHSTPATDMFTLLSPQAADGLLPMGIDRLLTNHELIAETMRTSPVAKEEWSILSLTEQANHIWQTLFLDNSPISEATRNVLTTLGMLDHHDLDPSHRDLNTYRAWFNAQNPVNHLNYILDRANLSSLVLILDPFSATPLAEPIRSNERIHTALSLTPLLSDWKDLSGLLKEQGVIKKKTADPASLPAIGE